MPEMSDHDFRTVVDALCTRFQADLQAQATELASRQTVEREKLAQEAESHWAQRLDNVREEWNGRLQAGLADAAADAERRLAAEAERARLEVEALTASAAEATDRHKKELDAVREEWQGRMQAGIADVTADADRRVIAETDRIRREAEEAAAASAARLREELEQASSQATGRLREEMDQALAAERERADVDLQGERSRVHALISERDHIASDLEAEHLKTQTLSLALEEAQAAATRDRESVRAAMAATETRHQEQESEKDAQAMIEARAAERQAQLAAFERMLASVRAIGSARSLSDTLNALVDAASAIAPRAALFITSPTSDAASAGMHLQGWKGVGFAGDGFAKLRIATTDAAAAGCLGPAVTEGRPVATTSSPAPSFANLPAQRAGLAVPISVGGTSVAVLYADDAPLEEPESPASWPEGLQILAAHGSACLAQITAARTAQAVRQMAPGVTRTTAAGVAASATSPEEDSSARRYARLLVSEIKLYNEAAVRAGRQKRDLLTRLAPEIDRARRLYEERVSPAIGARAAYFQQELVHTLADGDSALLGNAR